VDVFQLFANHQSTLQSKFLIIVAFIDFDKLIGVVTILKHTCNEISMDFHGNNTNPQYIPLLMKVKLTNDLIRNDTINVRRSMFL